MWRRLPGVNAIHQTKEGPVRRHEGATLGKHADQGNLVLCQSG